MRAGYLVTRVVLVWLLTAGTLFLLSAIMPGFHVTNALSALAAAAFIGLANALVWPVLVRIALPFTVLTLGLGALVLNGAHRRRRRRDRAGRHVDGVLDGVVVAHRADGRQHRSSPRCSRSTTTTSGTATSSAARRAAPARRTSTTCRASTSSRSTGSPTTCCGARSATATRRTSPAGCTTARHRLLRWETDWSSQTGACQAGLLHGDNDDMPAFRWWEKDRGGAIVTNHPRDAAELERRHSNGRGLLHEDGASRANILSGDAVHTLLTMSTVLDRARPGRIGQDYFALLREPLRRHAHARCSRSPTSRRSCASPRSSGAATCSRASTATCKYALVRAWGTVVQRDLQVAAVIADIYAGRPVGYTTFLAYDEVAHHSGVERADALAVLRQVDRQIGRIAEAAQPTRRGRTVRGALRPRPVAGRDVPPALRRCRSRSSSRRPATRDDVRGAGRGQRRGARAIWRLADRGGRRRRRASARTVDRAVRAPPGRRRCPARRGRGRAGAPGADRRRARAVGDGVGQPRADHVPARARAGDARAIEARWPALIPALRDHPGIGFVLVRSERDGAVVIGAGGVRLPRRRPGRGRATRWRRSAPTPRSTCAAPTASRTARTSSSTAPTGTDLDEVAAFEELVGSHGGMGGEQALPVRARSRTAGSRPTRTVVGAEAVHRHFRRWLAELGHDAYR